jgi:heme/copper-type cytochrome/quinol oxidase subunit 3
MNRPAPIADLSRLPAAGFGPHGLWWWAGCAFMLMEGAAFALAFGTYFYLMSSNSQWPLGEQRPPDLLWGTLQTALLVGSLWPTWIMSRAARRLDRGKAAFWAVVVAALNALALVVRAFEFPHLNSHWDHDAYGSVTWALMLLHTTHLVTDFVDTFFLTVILFTHPVTSDRLSDLDDDALYWAFVVASWIPIYLLVYWAPRLAP